MKGNGKGGGLRAWFAAVSALLPGNHISAKAPSLHKRDTKAEVSARNAAAFKRARKQGKAKPKPNGNV